MSAATALCGGGEPLLGAGPDDVLDLGDEPEVDEPVPEAQAHVDAPALLAGAGEDDAAVEALARDAAPTACAGAH